MDIKDNHIINSESSFTAFVSNARAMFDEYKYSTFSKPRIGEDRSISQNSLLHVWVTEFIAEVAGVSVKAVKKSDIKATKRTLKKSYYNYSGHRFLIERIECKISGQSKNDYTSSADWSSGEMYQFLTWFQLEAANFGVILESKGRFKANQIKENA